MIGLFIKSGRGWFRVVMLVTVILTATRVLAQERLVIGEGSTSCGAWTQARQAQSPNAALIAQWIAGYVSGSNVEGEQHPDALVGVDVKGLIGWIDNYCRSNLSTRSSMRPLSSRVSFGHEPSVDERYSGSSCWSLRG
jgi:hypothetical protein